MATDLETPAAIVEQDSAPAAVVEKQAPSFDAADQHTWSSEQRQKWNRTGEQPTKADSATANKEAKDKAAPDSAPDKGKKPAANASDSATDSQQKPNLKTKEDTERRFNELLDSKKALEREVETLRREKTQPARESRQESQPAAEVYKPLDEKEFFKTNPKATYEDFVRAAGKHEGVWAARQEIAAENQRRAQAEAQKELSTKVAEAKTRYPDFDEKVAPAVGKIMDDQQIPYAVKSVINDSPVFTDLVYVLADPKALQDIIQTAKTNPGAALRKIFITEQLVQAELAKGKTATANKGDASEVDAGRERGADGKFVSGPDKEDKASAEPKPRAPKPPSEVGGRGTAPEDQLRTAAEKGDFRSFEAEQTRRMKARANA